MTFKEHIQPCVSVGRFGKDPQQPGVHCGIFWRQTDIVLRLRDPMISLRICQKVLPWKEIFMQTVICCLGFVCAFWTGEFGLFCKSVFVEDL